MEMGKSTSPIPKLLGLFLILSLAVPSLSITYVVPWKTSVDLTTYTLGKTFYVGDVLLFKYTRFVSAVFVVDLIGFTDCDQARGYSADFALSGNTSVSLNTTGPMYFISYFQDCLQGQKLQVTVRR